MARKPKLGLGVTHKEIKEQPVVEQSVQPESKPEHVPEPKKIIQSINDQEDEKYPYTYKSIPFEKMRFSEDNDFNTSHEECISKGESILKNGLIHALTVVYDIDDDMYTVISGEKRVRGCMLIKEEIESGNVNEERRSLYEKHIKGFFKTGFPCNVKTGLNAIEQKLLINVANLDVTRLTAAELAQKIQEQKDLYTQLALEKGENPDKSYSSKIAQDLNIGQRQVQKYNKINENLIPELKELFDQDKMNVNEGSTFAKLSREEQLKIRDVIESGRKVDNQELHLIKLEIEEKNKKTRELEEECRQAKEKNTVLEKKLKELPDETSIKEKLKKELEASEQSEYKKQLQEIQEEKEKIKQEKEVIAKELAKKEAEIKKMKSASEMSESEKSKIRDKMKIEAVKEEIKANIKQLNDMLNQYSSFYQEKKVAAEIKEEVLELLK